ncbi:ATP-dependent helicase [Candidatus Saccharibacteria bacterium]|nr:ATP-dependent helicase [Candidatus Saccharibacteria bacterium]
MSLNARQKEAVEYIEGPLLVLAGPGTGKTHLLSNRVEYILQNTDTNPENILCLTFTENGASNMRTRLISTVGKAARNLEIHTYHAFGADLLAKYRNYTTTFDRNLDASIDEVTQFKIIKEIQENLNANDILRSDSTKDIVDTINSAKSARLTSENLAKIAEDNILFSDKFTDEIQDLFSELVPRMKFNDALEKFYKPLLTAFASHTSNRNIVKDIEPLANTLYLELKKTILEESARERPSISPLTKWTRANFIVNDNGEHQLKTRVPNLKLRSLSNIMRLYDEKLSSEGLYDFSDMIEQAIKALKTDKGFRLTMSERFQYILLDEFQDTNPSQFEIVKLLTDYEDPNIMAVGDDDQAIFEFQGAEASNLLTFQQHYHAKVINLEENYRSNQEILDLSRKIADQIDGSFVKNPAIESKTTISKQLQAAKGAGATIVRHEFLTSDGEYSFVTSEIEKLIDAGVPQKEIAIIAPKHKYIAPMLPFLKDSGKINISYEKRDNLLEDPRLSEILTLAKFIYNLSQGRNISSQLLEILSFGFWEVSPSEAIRCIWSAKQDKKAPIDYLVKADSPRLRDIGEFLARCAMLSFDTPLELMLDYFVGTVAVKLPSEFSSDKDLSTAMISKEPEEELISKEGKLRREAHEFRSPFIEFYSHEQNEYETFELYENLSVLKDAILSHTKTKNLRLKDLITLLNDYETAGAAIINTSPYRDNDDAIQILTAHKAKGLEYEYVFLIATDNLNWGRAKGNNNMLVLPKNMLQIRHTGITDDERLRLLFVAMTRAKSCLIMTNSLKDFSGKTPARLDYLEEYVDKDTGDVVSPFVGKVVLHYDDLSSLRKKIDLRKSWRSAYTKLSPDLRSILLAQMENYLLSPSDLTSFIDISYGGPMEFYKNRVLRAPSEPATGSMVFGTLMHKVFEQATMAASTGEKFTDEDAITMYRKEVEEADLPDADTKFMLERGEVSLKISLETFKDILRDPKARAEVNLYGEHPVIDGIPVIGVIDHMHIDEEKKEIEVYDFKTGKYHKERWGSINTLYKYSLQLGMYKLMLEHSPTYSKYKVTRGHILFVTPDDEGKVYDKTLDFDKDIDENELRALIRAVHKQATTLAFLDDDELRVEPNKENGMKEIRNFIQLLLEKTDT